MLTHRGNLAARFLSLASMATIGSSPAFAREETPGPAIPPAIGPHVRPKAADFAGARSFRGDERIVMTHYFYWYDAETGEHMRDGDGTDALTTHPASLNGFSYRSPAWHKRQLLDMMEAGIDVVLPVFWGAPSEHRPGSQMSWSFAGLPPLVRAAEDLVREGKSPPAIGLFYDTSTLRFNSWGVHVDLTTDYGRRWFYGTIRDFFSMIPPRLWATIDGKPIVVLYSASFAKAHDQGCIDFLKAQFPREFAGRVPHVIREVSWKVKADDVCAWGGALRPNFAGVAEIGPGYDHSSVPGRTPLIVSREGGKFYENAWLKVLKRRPKVVILETWNEFHEGTDIADSREHGRRYIELTRKYVDLFKHGAEPPEADGPFRGARAVDIVPGREGGLKRVDVEDGRTTPAGVAGKACLASRPGRAPYQTRYVYFQVDDSFKWARSMDVTVEVEYFDGDRGSFAIQYDSHDQAATLGGAYKQLGKSIGLAGSHTWKSATFRLTDARFEGTQNGGADFRIAADGPELFFGRVAVVHGDGP